MYSANSPETEDEFLRKISSNNRALSVKTLSLIESASKDPKTGITGWHLKWGATGLCPLGDGLFYISHNEKSIDGQQQCTIYQYRWVGDANNPFVRVEK